MITGKTRFFLACVLLTVFTFVFQATAQDSDALLAVHGSYRDAMNARDVESVVSYFTDDAVWHYLPLPLAMNGKEEITALWTDVFQAFPDFHVEERRILVSGNIMITECTVTGTHLGEWMGIPPTGNSLQTIHMDVYDFEGDKIKQKTTYDDAVSFMIQDGLMPAPEPLELVPTATPPDPEAPGLPALEAAENIAAVWNTGDIEGYIKLIHSDIEVLLAPLGVPLDRDAFMAVQELYFMTYPDLQQEAVRMVDMGDGWVLAEVVFIGTNDGPYFGLPATGNVSEVRGTWLSQFDEDGLMTYMSVYWDELTTMTNLGLFPPLPPMPEPPPIPEAFIQDQITSPSLEGNLLGDSATRDVLVYLPPSYETSPDKSYPTIYVLHGFAGDHRMFVGVMNVAMQSLTGIDLGIQLDDIIAGLLATGGMGEAIIVIPNGSNVYGGGRYERSEVLGDYRDFIARDLVGYIDGKYRTIADREHRGIMGHSMGGYGALSLAIEYNDVFGATAGLSPGGDIEASPTHVENFIAENPDTLGEPILVLSDEDLWRMYLTKFRTNALYSLAAAYSPNPSSPPYYVDLPVQYPDKTIVQDVWDKWKERSLVGQIEQDGDNLSGTAILIDRGVGETMIMAEGNGVAGTLAALDAKGISYTYDEFPGDHVTHLQYQLASALTFLSPNIGAVPLSETERNKAIQRRMLEEVWNQKNLDLIDEVYASDFVLHDPAQSGLTGPDGYKLFATIYQTGFPDLQFTIEDQIASGDKVVLLWTATSTHLGEFIGIPPTGANVVTPGITINQIVNGQIVAEWPHWDALGLMQQLGVIAPGRPTPEDYMWSAPSEVTGDPGTPEANEAVLMRFVDEFWNQHNVDIASEILADDVVSHNPSISPMYPSAGVESFKQFATNVFTAFPDFGVTVNDLIFEGDKAVGRWTISGTHQDVFMGIPATGRHISVTGQTIYRFADGKIVELWWAWDTLGMMQQLTAGAQEEANKAIALRGYEEVWNQQSQTVYEEIYSPDLISHDPSGDLVGIEALKQLVGMYLTAAPDLHFTIEDQVAAGDMVATRWMSLSTNTGEFMGIPPTGNQGIVTGISIDRIVDGMIVESWSNYDSLAIMEHLEVLPRSRENYGWGDPSEVTGAPGDPEANKAIVVRSIDEVWNQGKLDVMDELSSVDSVGHSPVEPNNPLVGTESGKQAIAMYRTAFPDVHITIDVIIAEGDKVVIRWTSTGTHLGEFVGIPPSGNQFSVTGIVIYRFADGKIVEEWWAWDALGLIQQITALPEKDYSNVFFVSLEQGLNMISPPLEPAVSYTARSFAEEIGSTVVIRYDTLLSKFVGFSPAASGDGFDINGGEGYIVNVPEARVVAFTGAAWTNNPPVAAAPPAQRSSAWAFMVSGSVLDGDLMSASDGDYTAVVKNLRTGDTFAETVGPSGYFAAAWADLSRRAVIGAGDRVEVAVLDSNGNIVSGPFVHDVTLDAIRDAVVNVRLRLGDIIPEKSALLQNYPNPFNPETWIPYHLSDANPVMVKIYSASGQLIRALDLGYRDSGVYASRSKAAYWDGKNEAGEEVTSGIYFYNIQAGDFAATRKMVIAR